MIMVVDLLGGTRAILSNKNRRPSPCGAAWAQ
jgi:hypothetical protein